jgi:hypothetical protein
MVVGRIDLVAEVTADGGWERYIVVEVVADNEGCGCVVEVEGWRWWDATFDQAGALASALAGEGCWCCTVAPLALHALYWCAIFELRHAELMLASSWGILVLDGAFQFPIGLWSIPPLLRLRLHKLLRPSLAHGFDQARHCLEWLMLA